MNSGRTSTNSILQQPRFDLPKTVAPVTKVNTIAIGALQQKETNYISAFRPMPQLNLTQINLFAEKVTNRILKYVTISNFIEKKNPDAALNYIKTQVNRDLAKTDPIFWPLCVDIAIFYLDKRLNSKAAQTILKELDIASSECSKSPSVTRLKDHFACSRHREYEQVVHDLEEGKFVFPRDSSMAYYAYREKKYRALETLILLVEDKEDEKLFSEACVKAKAVNKPTYSSVQDTFIKAFQLRNGSDEEMQTIEEHTFITRSTCLHPFLENIFQECPSIKIKAIVAEADKQKSILSGVIGQVIQGVLDIKKN